jgi:hypothetical protein
MNRNRSERSSSFTSRIKLSSLNAILVSGLQNQGIRLDATHEGAFYSILRFM